MRLLAGCFDGRPIDHLEVLEAIAGDTGATVQAFDARYVVSVRHLERAVELADRAAERDDTIADDHGVEVLLYAAGRRHIDRALEMGLKAEDHPVVVVVDGGDEATAAEAVDATFDERLDLEANLGEEAVLCEFFGVTDEEAATGADLEDLVLERVALLSIDK